jgi:hypothetical protein
MTYKIMQLMPSEGGDFQYRIRNVHERVVKENGLDRSCMIATGAIVKKQNPAI